MNSNWPCNQFSIQYFAKWLSSANCVLEVRAAVSKQAIKVSPGPHNEWSLFKYQISCWHNDLKFVKEKEKSLSSCGQIGSKSSKKLSPLDNAGCAWSELSPIHDPAELQPRISLEPLLHTKLADVPFSIPAALSLHTSNGKALWGGIAGCSELKSSVGTRRGFCTPY